MIDHVGNFETFKMCYFTYLYMKYFFFISDQKNHGYGCQGSSKMLYYCTLHLVPCIPFFLKTEHGMEKPIWE